jgi:DNA invertase Pin-like site-specific DNA recombinase
LISHFYDRSHLIAQKTSVILEVVSQEAFLIIGYARVSTIEQDTALQLDNLQRSGCEKIYQESVSGISKTRPELDKCLDNLRSGDTLVVWRLDRLGRSLKDLVSIITDLELRNVGFRSVTEAVDTTTPGGKLVFHIFAALAEFERKLIQERTKAGLAAARARGRNGGRPLKLNNSQIKKAKAMLLDPQMTKAEVARHFAVSRTTLNKALNSDEK